MSQLPKVITTSVIRSARQGESHGGVYVVDLDSGEVERVIDWNDSKINWEGRGGDRGLRGIAFHKDKIYLAASDEIFVYSRGFQLLQSHKNKYLRRCHEIDIVDDTLYLTSTELNSILQFDLLTDRFTCGHTIARQQHERRNLFTRIRAAERSKAKFSVTAFDPNGEKGPTIGPNSADLHINNVSRSGDSIMISGTRIEALLALRGETLREYAMLPRGTHNAAVFKDGLLYNDTASDHLVVTDTNNRIRRSFAVPKFNAAELSHTDVPDDHARQGFARGLCIYNDSVVIGGSSPSTISAYDLETGETIKQVNISKDIRNCIHGLELWPS
jgi:WD40 repeat protein